MTNQVTPWSRIDPAVCLSDRIKIYIETHGARLEYNAPKIMDKALELYREHVRGEESITNHGNPRVTAAAIYYIASIICSAAVTQDNICSAFGVSINVLRRRYHFLGAKMGLLEWKEKPNLGFESGESSYKLTDKFYAQKWKLEEDDEQ